MLPCRILSAVICAFTFTRAVDVTWFAGDPDDCDNDCSGDTDTVDSVPENVCSDIGTLKSCILAEYGNSPVDYSEVYSPRNDETCGAAVGDVEDGEYVYACLGLQGYLWSHTRPAMAEATGTSSNEAGAEQVPLNRTRGYTVNGRMYNVGTTQEQKAIPKGSPDEKEKWLIANEYKVIKVFDTSKVKRVM